MNSEYYLKPSTYIFYDTQANLSQNVITNRGLSDIKMYYPHIKYVQHTSKQYLPTQRPPKYKEGFSTQGSASVGRQIPLAPSNSNYFLYGFGRGKKSFTKKPADILDAWNINNAYAGFSTLFHNPYDKKTYGIKFSDRHIYVLDSKTQKFKLHDNSVKVVRIFASEIKPLIFAIGSDQHIYYKTRTQFQTNTGVWKTTGKSGCCFSDGFLKRTYGGAEVFYGIGAGDGCVYTKPNMFYPHRLLDCSKPMNRMIYSKANKHFYGVPRRVTKGDQITQLHDHNDALFTRMSFDYSPDYTNEWKRVKNSWKLRNISEVK